MMRRMTIATALGLAVSLAGLPAWAQSEFGSKELIEAAEKEGQLTVYATTDQVVAGPLVKDFQALYPKIKVEYTDRTSTEVYNRFVSEAAAGS